jgi:hypothetical protein
MTAETQTPYTEPPPQLYHYTTKEAFLGILQSRCLWASHILYQNDRTEVLHTVEILKETLKRRFGEKWKDEYVELLSDFLKISVFTVSFSEKVDDLNQYRGYARSNPGFCVGFNTDYLKSFHVSTVNDDSPDWSCRLEKCDYNENEQEKSIDKIIDENIGDVKNPEDKNIKSELAENLFFRIREKSQIYKSAAFIDEQEWRLIISPKRTGTDPRIRERIKGSFFMPYFPISICTRCAIGDIYVLPCQEKDAVYDSVWIACENNDVKLSNQKRQLLPSAIPYRDF